MPIEIEFHPLAEIFPFMSEAEFSNLCADIKTNGQREPIYIWDNKIIDGRNRYNACQVIGVDPRFTDYKGEESELLKFIISLNLHRRHLNESQRAMVAAKLANLKRGDNRFTVDALIKASTQTEAAGMLNVSRASVQKAKQVQENATPELAAQVSSGDVAVSTAALLSTLPKDEQETIVAKGEQEILAVAKAIRTQKLKEKKNNEPQESNKEKTRTAWHGLVDKMGSFLLSAQTEATIELTVSNFDQRQLNSYLTSAIRLRDKLNEWIKIIENSGGKKYE